MRLTLRPNFYLSEGGLFINISNSMGMSNYFNVTMTAKQTIYCLLFMAISVYRSLSMISGAIRLTDAN